ncbi:MAG: GTPase [Clostridium sp.]|uniref:GTPase n=1 Tax=Clostridium sp. TaxID=1506 RepID=UPI003D6D4BAC
MKNNEEFYKEQFEESFDNENLKYEEITKSKLIISLIGDVNSGKSSTINALTGRKLSDVSAFAGETKDVKFYKYSDNVFIEDTPGLNDINQEVSRKAVESVDKDSDIIMLFFNAAVGASKPIVDTYHRLKKLNRPIIIVLNYIDIWYENGRLTDYESYNTVISQIESETGQKVIPISARKNINIDKLSNKIVESLQYEGKDLLFLKISRYKEENVKGWINGAAVSAFGIGLIPIPGADIIPLTTLQVALALRIAYIYNCKATKNDVMSLVGSTITGSFGKQLFKLGIQSLKGLGWLGGPLGEGAVMALAGAVASSVTFAFGWACNAYYKSGMQMDLGEMGQIFKDKYKESYESFSRKSKSEVASTTL